MTIKLTDYWKEIKKMKIQKGLTWFIYGILKTTMHFVITKEIKNPAYFMKKYSIVKYDGFIFWVDNNTSFGYYLLLNILEPETYSEITTGKRSLFIDVGANCGGYTIRASRAFKKVISIEPVPVMHEVVRRNLSLNSINNVEIINAAVSNYNGTSKFYISKLGQLSSFSRTLESVGAVEVKVIRLDKIIKEHEIIPDLIKIDTEGAEVDCVIGLGEYVNRVPKLIVEISSSDKLEKIRNFLKSYDCHQLNGEQNYMFVLNQNARFP